MKKLNVLSLFDGISAGQMALKKAEIEVDKYFASEIDKHAVHVTNKNFPNTIQLGDIRKWREWDIDWNSIDLVIGGSPCQGFSFAGKQLNFEDPRSKLFFVFLDICNHVADNNPKMIFLLENVKMKKEFQNVISEKMGIEPIEINSALLSAQNRKRLYWTNIPNIEQPKDKGIILKDIIQNENIDEKYFPSKKLIKNYTFGNQLNPDYKSQANTIHSGEKFPTLCAGTHGYANGYVKTARIVGRRLNEDNKREDNNKNIPIIQRVEINKNPNKTNCLTSVQKDNVLIIPEATKKGYCEVKPNNGVDLTFINSKTRRGRLMETKPHCLTASKYEYNWYNGETIRRLTPIECERLQTFPDNYTEGISDTQRYKALGNSWTVDVIVHIFKNL